MKIGEQGKAGTVTGKSLHMKRETAGQAAHQAFWLQYPTDRVQADGWDEMTDEGRKAWERIGAAAVEAGR